MSLLRWMNLAQVLVSAPSSKGSSTAINDTAHYTIMLNEINHVTLPSSWLLKKAKGSCAASSQETGRPPQRGDMPCVAPPLDGAAGWSPERVDMPGVPPPLDGAAGWSPERVDMPGVNPPLDGVAAWPLAFPDI